ncbi:MAG: hypothetical protein RI973_653 [Bacteroidota bacterium]|jgi:hypothetical protein
MKNLALLWWMLALAGALHSQTTSFNVELEEVSMPAFPALQSFVEGHHGGKWLLIGGRTEGLHRRQPFAAFDPDFNNTSIYVVDLNSGQAWSKPLAGLPSELSAQLSSSNMQFRQRDSVLYITGGYGYSPVAQEWITHPRLTAIHLPGLINAVVNGGEITPHFHSLTDERVRVTGGYLGLLGDEFYLVAGQNFEGRYNPMGPSHGPGFFQAYTNAIKKFRIADNGGTPAISDYTETVDTANLHRRDYNLVPQVFPDGEAGFTAFSGVFQYNADLPWLNTVDIRSSGYTVNNDFQQFLNQYHTAHVPMYSAFLNEMHTVFFGGISRYFFNAAGVLTDDPEVPFVKTISLVTRHGDGAMEEVKLGDMPALLGAGAAFLPAEALPLLPNGVLDFDALADGQVLGFVAGGIESTLPNVLFLNGDNLSAASNRLFRVVIRKSATPVVDINGERYFGLKLFPNPGGNKLTVNFSVPLSEEVQLTVTDAAGRTVKQEKRQVDNGEYEWYFDVSDWVPGSYFVELKNTRYRTQQSYIKGQ